MRYSIVLDMQKKMLYTHYFTTVEKNFRSFCISFSKIEHHNHGCVDRKK